MNMFGSGGEAAGKRRVGGFVWIGPGKAGLAWGGEGGYGPRGVGGAEEGKGRGGKD